MHGPEGLCTHGHSDLKVIHVNHPYVTGMYGVHIWLNSPAHGWGVRVSIPPSSHSESQSSPYRIHTLDRGDVWNPYATWENSTFPWEKRARVTEPGWRQTWRWPPWAWPYVWIAAPMDCVIIDVAMVTEPHRGSQVKQEESHRSAQMHRGLGL